MAPGQHVGNRGKPGQIGWKWMDKWRTSCEIYRMGMDGAFFDLADLRITSEILALVAEIDEFKGAWRAIGRIAPETLSGLRRVATIESVGSSTRIEGAKLSNREVERLLSNLRLRSF